MTTPSSVPAVGSLETEGRGQGARFNTGKPPLDMLPIRTLLDYYIRKGACATDRVWALDGLRALADFQEGTPGTSIHDALDVGGIAGLEEAARVFDHARHHKYKTWNWAQGMPWTVPLGCAVRHLRDVLEGEDTDKDTGHPHRGHYMCNVVMLEHFSRAYPEGNNLPPKGLLSGASDWTANGGTVA